MEDGPGTLATLIAALALASVHVFAGRLAGGIVLNVLKEELPNERKSSLSAFVAGAALYAALLLAV